MKKPRERSYSLEVARRIRELRIVHELTQQDIANGLKIDRSTYTYYETGRISLPLETLKDLAIFYGVSSDYLLGITVCPAV